MLAVHDAKLKESSALRLLGLRFSTNIHWNYISSRLLSLLCRVRQLLLLQSDLRFYNHLSFICALNITAMVWNFCYISWDSEYYTKKNMQCNWSQPEISASITFPLPRHSSPVPFHKKIKGNYVINIHFWYRDFLNLNAVAVRSHHLTAEITRSYRNFYYKWNSLSPTCFLVYWIINYNKITVNCKQKNILT